MLTLKQINLLILTYCLLVCTIAMAKTFPEGLILPGERVGNITAETSEADLIRDFGKQNLEHKLINLGEGETQEATVLYPNDPRIMLQIFWLDYDSRKNPTMIRIIGSQSIWKTRQGIGLGSSLKEIEEHNEAPFSSRWL